MLCVAVVNEDIILKLNQGDVGAFEMLYSASYVYLCAVATKYVYDYETAREIVNDVFLNVWNKRETLEYPIKAYLIRSVRNRSLNYLRSMRTEDVSISELDEYMISYHAEQNQLDAEPLKTLENKEFEELVADAVSNLPEKCRNIFTQYLYHHKSYDEIAQLYDITNSTVRVQIRIALSKMKEFLGDSYLFFIMFYDITFK